MRDYERKIRNLLVYSSPEAREMALRILGAARRDVNLSTWHVRHLESLFGPEKRKEWFGGARKKMDDGVQTPA